VFVRDVRDILTTAVREILESVNAGVYITDSDRRIVYWNRRAAEITGHRPEDVIGTRCSDGVLEHMDKEGRRLCVSDLCPLHRSMTTGRPSSGMIAVFAKDGRGGRTPVSVATAPIHDEEGRVIGGVEIFRDDREHIHQMQLARAAQRSMLTADVPEDGRISLDVRYLPVDMIGGDYHHLVRATDDVFSLFVADVIGHGTSAALYIALIHSLVLECADRMADPAALLEGMNERLCARAPEVQFVPAIAASFDAGRRAVRYASAGHPPAFLQTAANEVRTLEASNIALGLVADGRFEAIELELEPGDRVLAYTDGATDIETAGDKRLGEAGLRSLVERFPPKGTRHRLRELSDALVGLSTAHMPHDDITLVSAIML
jgi:PAS domain S-box-containing protein